MVVVLDELTAYRDQIKGFRESHRGRGYVGFCPFHDDRNHPSLRIDDKNGIWLWYCDVCMIGGNLHQLLEKMGNSQEASTSNTLRGEPTATYDYIDPNGKLLFQVCRFESNDRNGKKVKTFYQRRPNGNGGWINAVPQQIRTIYNLHAVIKAQRVLIVEGEKDVATAKDLDLVATCNPMGAGKWLDKYSELLRDKDVVILPDNDEPGRNHAQQICVSLLGKAKSIKIVELPGAGDKQDLSDWVLNAKTSDPLCADMTDKEQREYLQDQLTALIEKTLAVPEPSVIEAPAARNGELESNGIVLRSDLGNAKRLVLAELPNVHFCHATKQWYVWNGTRWAVDSSGEVIRRAKQIVQSMLVEASTIEEDKERRALIAHELKSESEPRLRAMVNLAQSEPGIPILFEDFDRDPMLFNVLNGTIDLRTCQLREHRREDLITKIAPVKYDPNASCRKWRTFVSDITAGDGEDLFSEPERIDLQNYLQKAAGYSLTGLTKHHTFFILWGVGQNGKSTYLETLQHVLGDYAQTAEMTSFMMRKSESVRNDIAALAGARFVTASESEDNQRLAEALIKQLTGGDSIRARFLFKEGFEFKPQFKLWLRTNNKPVIRGQDEGIWRRIKLIPFTVHIPDERKDEDLPDKLRGETSGILNWLLEGLTDWHKHGLKDPKVVTRATKEYREEQDTLQQFFDSRCVFTPSAKVSKTALFDSYKEWAAANNLFTKNSLQFGKELSERGFKEFRTNARRGWLGIGLADEPW